MDVLSAAMQRTGMESMRITQCATDASLDRGAGLTGQRSTFLAGLLGVEAPPPPPPPPPVAA